MIKSSYGKNLNNNSSPLKNIWARSKTCCLKDRRLDHSWSQDIAVNFFSYQLFNKHCLSTDSASGALNALRNGDLHELEKQQPILPKEEKKANWWLRGSGKMKRINYY